MVVKEDLAGILRVSTTDKHDKYFGLLLVVASPNERSSDELKSAFGEKFRVGRLSVCPRLEAL